MMKKIDLPFDTVGALKNWLEQFSDDTPVVATYTGDGRVSGVASYDDVTPKPACVAIFQTNEAWLRGNDLPLHNPVFSQQ